MKITQDVRKYAEGLGVGADQAIEIGLQAKSAEFAEKGGSVYLAPEA
jgi:phosphomethylpyrimidine synthase